MSPTYNSDSSSNSGSSTSDGAWSRIDSCKHRIIYTPEGEWVCCLCGRVFSAEEAEELQRGSTDITIVKNVGEAGLDPHGKTPLWHMGLGSLEGNGWEGIIGEGGGRGKGRGRDYTSMLSNIADKLQLPSYAMLEFADLYRSFVKNDRDKAVSAKLALLLLTERYEEVRRRIKQLARQDFGSDSVRTCVEYIATVVDNQFRPSTSPYVHSTLIVAYEHNFIPTLIRIARRKGAYNALSSLHNYGIGVI